METINATQEWSEGEPQAIAFTCDSETCAIGIWKQALGWSETTKWSGVDFLEVCERYSMKRRSENPYGITDPRYAPNCEHEIAYQHAEEDLMEETTDPTPSAWIDSVEDSVIAMVMLEKLGYLPSHLTYISE